MSHRAVVVPSLEPDAAEGRVAGRDTDPDLQHVAALPPVRGQVREVVAHRDGQRDGAGGVVLLQDRVVEEGHEPVSGEVLQRALVGDDERTHDAVVRAQEAEDLLGLGRLREAT